jgi:transposase-like protein
MSRQLRLANLPKGLLAKAIQKISYNGYRFPPEIIRQAIWVYLRFTSSLRDVEDLLAERGITESYETGRRVGESFWTDDRLGAACELAPS